jgi:hypothetical protein
MRVSVVDFRKILELQMTSGSGVELELELTQISEKYMGKILPTSQPNVYLLKRESADDLAIVVDEEDFIKALIAASAPLVLTVKSLRYCIPNGRVCSQPASRLRIQR